MLSKFFSSTNIPTMWNIHFGAHQYWKSQVYQSFNISNIKEVLNVEPAIDHEDYYNATIPEYFKSQYKTLDWVDTNLERMNENQKIQAKKMIAEAACIYAADAMCHPRDKVGNFDWQDVVDLHKCLRTPYEAFIKKHNINVAFRNGSPVIL